MPGAQAKLDLSALDLQKYTMGSSVSFFGSPRIVLFKVYLQAQENIISCENKTKQKKEQHRAGLLGVV